MERTKRFSYNPKRNSAVEILLRCYSLCQTMYRPTEPINRCQCCQQGVAFTDFEGSSDFFGNDDPSQIVHSSDNPCCGARHLPASTALLGICRPRPLAQVAVSAVRQHSHRSPVAFIVYLSPFTIHLTGGRLPPLHLKCWCVL